MPAQWRRPATPQRSPRRLHARWRAHGCAARRDGRTDHARRRNEASSTWPGRPARNTGTPTAASRSDHRVVEQRLDRAPFLATGTLPMVTARTEAAAIAAIAGVAHQQLVGDVLEIVRA